MQCAGADRSGTATARAAPVGRGRRGGCFRRRRRGRGGSVLPAWAPRPGRRGGTGGGTTMVGTGAGGGSWAKADVAAAAMRPASAAGAIPSLIKRIVASPPVIDPNASRRFSIRQEQRVAAGNPSVARLGVAAEGGGPWPISSCPIRAATATSPSGCAMRWKRPAMACSGIKPRRPARIGTAGSASNCWARGWWSRSGPRRASPPRTSATRRSSPASRTNCCLSWRTN